MVQVLLSAGEADQAIGTGFLVCHFPGRSGRSSCGPNTSSSFHLTPAGQQSGRLASYSVDHESGDLTPLETYEVGNNPMWVLMTTLDG